MARWEGGLSNGLKYVQHEGSFLALVKMGRADCGLTCKHFFVQYYGYSVRLLWLQKQYFYNNNLYEWIKMIVEVICMIIDFWWLLTCPTHLNVPSSYYLFDPYNIRHNPNRLVHKWMGQNCHHYLIIYENVKESLNIYTNNIYAHNLTCNEESIWMELYVKYLSAQLLPRIWFHKEIPSTTQVSLRT